MSWIYNGESISSIDSKYCGFVYLITNLTNNKQYFGKKTLKFRKTKQVKGKKKKILVESDWKTYWSSSEILKEDVKKLGEENFKREILMFCQTKSEMSYHEAKYQMLYDVLLHPDKYYNEWVCVKTRRAHLLTKALLSKQNVS